MPQLLIFLLLVLALAAPIIGAIAVRVLMPRFSATQLYVAIAMVFALASASAVALGRAELDTLRVGGLTVLVPDAGLAPGELQLPPDLTIIPAPEEPSDEGNPVAAVPTEAPAGTPTPAVTSTPTAEPTPEPPTPEPPTPEPPTPEPPAPEPPAPIQFRVVNTEAEGLRLRPEPNTEGQPIKKLSDGTVVTVIGDDVPGPDFAWKHVRDPEGVEGWVAGNFLEPAP